jgi:hypothetical protein
MTPDAKLSSIDRVAVESFFPTFKTQHFVFYSEDDHRDELLQKSTKYGNNGG